MAFTVAIRNRKKYVTSETPINGHNVLAELGPEYGGDVIAWRVNNYIRPLEWVVEDDAVVDFIPVSSPDGLRIYRRSLDFLLVIACGKVLGRKAILRHSIGEGHYWEFEDGAVTQADVYKLHAAMSEMVRQDIPICRKSLPIDKARRIFEEQGEPEIAELFVRANMDPVEVYRCGERFGYFCGTMAPSTGLLKTFDIVLFAHGMVLQFPTADSPGGIPPFCAEPSLGNVFIEYAHWLKVLNLNYLSSLHRCVADGKVQELVLISEAFYSQRLSRIAEEIASRPGLKVVTIAGPSGSGKTTFSERLKIQLIVCGKNPVTLPMDNYFVNRTQTPRDENGEYDYERLDALDLDLLEDNLTHILAGEEVVTPRFDFIKGEKQPGKVVRLGPSDILIMEGIHGLNDRIVSMLPEGSRYGVFVSPLTGICIDPPQPYEYGGQSAAAPHRPGLPHAGQVRTGDPRDLSQGHAGLDALHLPLPEPGGRHIQLLPALRARGAEELRRAAVAHGGRSFRGVLRGSAAAQHPSLRAFRPRGRDPQQLGDTGVHRRQLSGRVRLRRREIRSAAVIPRMFRGRAIDALRDRGRGVRGRRSPWGECEGKECPACRFWNVSSRSLLWAARSRPRFCPG